MWTFGITRPKELSHVWKHIRFKSWFIFASSVGANKPFNLQRLTERRFHSVFFSFRPQLSIGWITLSSVVCFVNAYPHRIAIYLVHRVIQSLNNWVQGKPRQETFWARKAISLIICSPKTAQHIRLKLLVWREPLFILRICEEKQLWYHKVWDFATAIWVRNNFATFKKGSPNLGHYVSKEGRQ